MTGEGIIDFGEDSNLDCSWRGVSGDFAGVQRIVFLVVTSFVISDAHRPCEVVLSMSPRCGMAFFGHILVPIVLRESCFCFRCVPKLCCGTAVVMVSEFMTTFLASILLHK